MRRFILTVGYAAVLGGLWNGSTLAQTCGGECDVRGNPPPASLQGDGGDGSDYLFHHMSDAGAVRNDDGSHIRQYRYLIWNKNKERELDVEWSHAGLNFQKISPGCCVVISRQSCRRPLEDPDAVIQYGGAKTFSKQASAYLPQAAGSTSGASDVPGHLLSATISGTFRWLDKVLRVFVIFQTTADTKGNYSYTIVNKADAQLNFEMRALTGFWSERELLKPALASSSWRSADGNPDRFVLRGAHTLDFKQVCCEPILENDSDLTIYAPVGKSVLVRANVSVWEPSARR